ncbi:hypothetical protein AMJ83_07660 [candidate division WOR_3 bacterium SM23_42]|uniref:DUF5723 domain-containing protein n=1 Tax=candidate division WOR_3 bacterium SM23_42 TaxID=1703779 RepID=A0A0S8FR97_UNCW3|nr:MAG: hypothetical protein AMJ83_07660 [candidate division WOR_3 bacterium SM23_42]
MKYALILLIMLSLSSGLVTESFRYQSTAGFFEDDYDLLFDPARIPEIGGARLWTSLANFVTGDETLFSDGSQPHIVIGGVAALGSLHPGGMYDRRADKTALNTGLNDPFGNPMYGDGELTIINWNNPDTLGNFTNRTVETTTRSAYETIESSDWYLALATRLNSTRLGIGFMHRDYRTAFTDPNDNFTYEYFVQDLEADTLEYQENASFGGDDVVKNSDNAFVFSAWLDREKVSFGFNLDFALLSTKNEAVIIGDSAEYDYPMQPDTSYTEVAILDSLMQPQNGNRITIGLKSFYNYSENTQGRFYLDLFTQSLDYGDDAMDHFFKTREQSYNTFTWDTVNAVTYYDGSRSTKGLRVGTRHLFNVSERLKFGIGFFFNTSSYSDSTAAIDTTVDITVFDNGDTISGPEDYTRTITQSETWMTQVDGSMNSFVIPVGLEFLIIKPLVFRLGAQHTLSYNDYTTTVELVDYQPQRTLTVYGDGSQSEVIQDPGPRPERSVQQETEKIPETNYYYGIGWSAGKNLQIDLMGFNEITDLSNWRLSVTLKFD